MKTFRGVRAELVSNYGSLHLCQSCKGAFIKARRVRPKSGASIQKCEDCANDDAINKNWKIIFGSFSGAKFKCPASLSGNGCEEKCLTFRELVLGRCCRAALRRDYDIGKCNIFELVGKYYKEANMEEKKEAENVLRLRKSSKKLNLSTQRQRMNVREINDLTADLIKHLTTGWNDNQRKILQPGLAQVDESLGEILNLTKTNEDTIVRELSKSEEKLEKASYERESIERRMMYLLSGALKNVF